MVVVAVAEVEEMLLLLQANWFSCAPSKTLVQMLLLLLLLLFLTMLTTLKQQ